LSFSFYGAGCYSNGSYAYSSWTRDRGGDSASTFSSSTAFNQDASGTWVNRTTGISTSGVNGTFVYTASAGNTFEQSQSASDGWTEHEEGTYSGYRWNVSSGTFDEGSAYTSSYSSAGSSSASDGTAFSANSSFSGSGGQRSNSHLHQEGTFGTGSWNLSCYLQTVHSTGSDTLVQYGSAGVLGPTGQSSATTYTYNATGTYDLYAAGNMVGGSYSYGSYALDYKVTSNAEATESGSNATFSSFERDDKDLYSYSYSVRGTGGAGGSWTQSALETIARNFDGTLSGGGTVSSHGMITMGYSGSGGINLATGLAIVASAAAAKPTGGSCAALTCRESKLRVGNGSPMAGVSQSCISMAKPMRFGNSPTRTRKRRRRALVRAFEWE